MNLCLKKVLIGVAAALLAVAVVVGFHAHAHAHAVDVGVPTSSTPTLEGLWESYPIDGGDAVETFSIAQGAPRSKQGIEVLTAGSYSSMNLFSYADFTLTGVVTGAVNEDGTKITWSHGYVSKLISKTPTDLNGVWTVYKVNPEKTCHKPEVQDVCSVIHRDTKVSAYCKESLLTEYALDTTTGALTGAESESAGVVVSNSGVYFEDKSLLAVRGPPPPEHAYGGKASRLIKLACAVVAALVVWVGACLVCRKTPQSHAPVTTSVTCDENKGKDKAKGADQKVVSPLIAATATGYPALV